MELFNEITILVVACLLFIFTDIGKNVDARVNGSWAIIGLVLFNLIVNVSVIVYQAIQACIKKMKTRKAKKGSFSFSSFFFKKSANSDSDSSGKSSGKEDVDDLKPGTKEWEKYMVIKR